MKYKAINYKFKIKRYALSALRNAQKAFTLLELLLVIAIIAVLAGIITFALRPAVNIQNATDVQTAAKASDIEKAIQLYALDNNGNLPGNILNKTSISYEEICREDANSTDNCINLNTLKPDYLSEIPVDEGRATEDISGYILKYNPEGNSIDVMSASEYESKTDEILSEGLVGYWRMDEASWNGTAGEVVDSGLYSHSGTASSGAYVGTGRFGSGGVFDGVNDFVEIPIVDKSKMTFDDFSISVWINASNLSAYGRIVSTYHGSNPRHFYSLGIDSTGTKVNFAFRDTIPVLVEVETSQVIPTNTWLHVIVVREAGETARIYIDGVESNSVEDNTSGEPIGPYGGIAIGWDEQRTTSSSFEGKIDEVRIYNRALSPSEVESLYEWAPGPVAHWRFDEGSGTTAFDSSDNGNDGSFVGDPAWISGKYGSALDFDGNDYVDITSYSKFPTGSQDRTVLAWVYPTSFGSNITHILHYGNNTAYQAWGLTVWNDNKFGAHEWNGYSRYGGVDTDTWTHIAISLTNGNVKKFYQNGELITTDSDDPTPNTVLNYTPKIGTRITPAEYFRGRIDELKVYNYARTQVQILEDMENF